MESPSQPPSQSAAQSPPPPTLPPHVRHRKNVPLSSCGTFQLGGPVQHLIDCADPATLLQVRQSFRSANLPVLLIGGGSNLLFSDAGWPGCIVRFQSNFLPPQPAGPHQWRVSASVSLDDLAAWACNHGHGGLEAFSGIPGTLGGAVVGNAGAWGVQIADKLNEIIATDPEGHPVRLPPDACGFAYRDSRLKHDGHWVAEVVLHTHPADPDTLRQTRAEILKTRAEKHPDWKTTPCIGSFFRNLDPTSAAERRQAAGWFLETAGAKSLRIGGARVFERHANIPIKADPACTATDVATLARELQHRVLTTHNLTLIREVRYLGSFPHENPHPGFF